MIFEIATISVQLGATSKVVDGIAEFSNLSKATLYGCWASEIGELNRVVILRSFNDPGDLRDERAEIQSALNPFGSSEGIDRVSFESYLPFPSVEAPQPGKHGPIYELRTYHLKLGGLRPTLDAWTAALPARIEVSPLSIALYSCDGPSRITHLWPYATLEQRAAVRAKSVADGVWPPKGGPQWLTSSMTSQILLPTQISPLQ